MAEKHSKDQVVKALLDTAFINSVGATSLTNVADALHIKKSSLYNYFNSRDDMIYQSIQSCSEYLSQLNFIPENLEEIVKKYPVSTVLKGMISRFIKMHEKEPLFQIYTFIQEQKFFSKMASDTIIEGTKRIAHQSEKVLHAFYDNGNLKIKQDQLYPVSLLFAHSVNDLLSEYLVSQKFTLKEGELTPVTEETLIEKINSLVEDFATLIQG